MDYAVLADDLGYDSLWVADHLQLGKDGAILEGWTTLAALAGMTRRAALGSIHLSNVLRNPAHVAKMAATLDQISGGRLIFFFDAGWNQVESQAYGYEFLEPDPRLARMREALELIRRLWTEPGPIDHDGPHYQVHQALCEPKPIQQPHPPIWIGEARHDGLVDAAAALGQGWNSVPASPEELAAKLLRLAAACARANRDVADLEISLETQILIAPSHTALDEAVERIETLRLAETAETPMSPHLGASASRTVFSVVAEQQNRWLMGTPDEVVDQIRAFQALGVSHLMLWFLDAPDTSGLRLYAEKVRPGLSSIILGH